MKNLIITITLILITNSVVAQTDEIIIQKIYHEQLNNSPIYENLRYLTKEIGNRLSGSQQLAASVDYTRQLMIKYKFDTVYVQPAMVANWIRGEKEIVRIINSPSLGNHNLNCLALGNSIGTCEQGLTGNIIEINGLEDLQNTDKKLINGKIVFLNQPLDNSIINTFDAYSKVSGQRNSGTSLASIKGAIAVIVRSLSFSNDTSPHTGYMGYDEGINKIPAVAISTNDADLLSALIEKEPKTTVYLELHCQTNENVLSHNVIGEIKGIEFPDEIIVVGGHLDSWDVGEGAQDDGGGCLQAIEVLRSFRVLDIQPKRTLRVVMWTDEENSEGGSMVYAEKSKQNKETHIAAIEADYGAFIPIGFNIDTENELALKRIMTWKNYFEPYQIYQFSRGHALVDITPLKNSSILLMGLLTDSQRYFTLAHSEKDVFEAVDPRELELGAAAMTAMVYLIDKYGIK